MPPSSVHHDALTRMHDPRPHQSPSIVELAHGGQSRDLAAQIHRRAVQVARVRAGLYYSPSMVFRGQTLGKYRLSSRWAAAASAPSTWPKTPGSTSASPSSPHRQTLDFSELLREPRLLASLNHPNIVTVITAEKQDGVFFIVMEYVPGETLETIIEQKGALDVAQALDYTCQIANAVDHAHRQGVIHRDLRPGQRVRHREGPAQGRLTSARRASSR
jgi:hypothetical protein